MDNYIGDPRQKNHTYYPDLKVLRDEYFKKFSSTQAVQAYVRAIKYINGALFKQIDLGIYDRDIYGEVTLASYTQNDPVEVHKVQLQKAQSKTNRLKLELEAMKNENNWKT